MGFWILWLVFMGSNVLVICYEFFEIFGIGFCCCVGFSVVKLGRFVVREKGTSEERRVIEGMIWIFWIWVFVAMWILVWRERERSEERNKREESHNEKREINGRLTGFRDQIGQF